MAQLTNGNLIKVNGSPVGDEQPMEDAGAIVTTVGSPGSDDNFPTEQAVREALDPKAPLASPTFTGNVTIPTAVMGGHSITDVLVSTDGASTSDTVFVTPGWIDANAGGGGGGNTTQAITYASSITPDISLGNVITVSGITGALTVNNATNTTPGEEVYIRFELHVIGGGPITLGANYVLLDSNNNVPTDPGAVFFFSGITTSTGTIEGGFTPVTGSIAQGSITQEINAQTGTSYTLVDSDHGKLVTLDNAAAITLTVPSGLRSDFQCSLMQKGAGAFTLTASGTTIATEDSLVESRAQYAFVYLAHLGSEAYVATGGLA